MTMQRVNKRHSHLAARAVIPNKSDFDIPDPTEGAGDTPTSSTSEPPSSTPTPSSSSHTSTTSTQPLTSTGHTPSQTPTPTPPPVKPSSTSETSKTSPATTPSSTSSSTSSTSTSTSSSSSSSSSSSTGTTSSTSSTNPALITTKAAAPIATPLGTQNLLPESSFSPVTPTSIDSASTVTAGALDSDSGSTSHGGTIAGAVIGSLAGIAILGFIVIFLIRRVRHNRRRALHNSDFGTFNRSAFVTEKPTPEMQPSGHNVAPSISSMAGAGMAGFGSAATSAEATPPSQALANANAAAAAAASLQERPKYVYGQAPEVDNTTQQTQDQGDAATSAAAYTSEGHVQANYTTDTYGGTYAQYAEYADASANVVGGTGYQDAQREYQGQQGYDANQAAYFDQSGYPAGTYDQQTQQAYYNQQAYATDYTQTQYDYSQQQQTYESTHQTYDSTQYAHTQHYQAEAQAGYQAPHPYSTNAAPMKTDAAYGGM